MSKESKNRYDAYLLIEPIAGGAFGTVYKAKRRTDGVMFAIKEVEYGNQEEEDEIMREVAILATIHHENIVNLEEAFKHDEFIYMVMEYCGGGNLYDFLSLKRRNHEIVSEEDARQILWQLATAFDYLQNQCGILHRDLKPENVLFTHNGTAKIGDFGLSTQIRRDQTSKTMCGTPLYLAPELVLKQKQGFPADIWGLAMIMHELVTLQPPFKGSDAQMDQMRVSGRVVKEISPQYYSRDFISLLRDMRDLVPERRPTPGDIIARLAQMMQ